MNKISPVTYYVNIGDGKIVKCQIDQLMQCLEPLAVTCNETIENFTIWDNFSTQKLWDNPGKSQSWNLSCISKLVTHREFDILDSWLLAQGGNCSNLTFLIILTAGVNVNIIVH